MWTDTKVLTTMGVQTNTSKRKYELGPAAEDSEVYMNCSPIKTGRWSVTELTTSTTNTTIGLPTSLSQLPLPAAAVPAVSLSAPITTTNSNTNPLTTNPTITTCEDSIAKLEVVASVPCEPWNTEPIVDSISKLQAVTVPGDTWGGGATARSPLATALLSSDEFDDDDDDFEDEFDDDDSTIPTYCPLRYPPCTPPARSYMHQGGYSKPSFYSEPFPQQNCSRTVNHQQQSAIPPPPPPQQQPPPPPLTHHQQQHQHHHMRMTNFGWNGQQSHMAGNSYYGGGGSPETNTYSQQTIRCAENGKSYLDLGSCNFNSRMNARHSKGCCDGRGTWCNSKSCYKEIRLKIRNLSMFKLSRFRQVSEQSLYRSVLICNTLKQIDKELESEGKDSMVNGSGFLPTQQQINARLSMESNDNMNQGFQHQHHHHHHQQQQHQQHQQHQQQQQQQHQQHHQQQGQYSNGNNDSNRDFSPAFNQMNNRMPAIPFNPLCGNDSLHPYDHHPFRESQSGRATPFPTQTPTNDSDSGYGGDDDSNRSINWSSVLSLSSQSALDPLNNNDLFSTLPATSITSTSSSPSSSPSQSIITTTTTNVSGTFATQSFTNNSATPIGSTTIPSAWDYDFFDMDLGIRPEFTELLPSCKMSSTDDIFKSMSPALNASRYGHENELEAPAHIMVGS